MIDFQDSYFEWDIILRDRANRDFMDGKLMVFYQLTRRIHETNTTPIIYGRV